MWHPAGRRERTSHAPTCADLSYVFRQQTEIPSVSPSPSKHQNNVAMRSRRHWILLYVLHILFLWSLIYIFSVIFLSMYSPQVIPHSPLVLLRGAWLNPSARSEPVPANRLLASGIIVRRHWLTMLDPYIGDRSRGRLRKRWAEFFKQHAGVHWSSIARNRKEWKNLGEQLKNKKEL